MIEREAGVAKDRRLIAAVIYNRLKQGMPLGIDATIRYELEQLRPAAAGLRARARHAVQHAHPHRPAADADRQPGPRVAAGRGRTRRANDFLYYVVKPCGNGAHAFSSTDAQFQKDVAAYNRKRDELGGKDPSQLLSRGCVVTASASSAGRSPTAARRAMHRAALAAARPHRLDLSAPPGAARALRRRRRRPPRARASRGERHDPAQGGGARAGHRRRRRGPGRSARRTR